MDSYGLAFLLSLCCGMAVQGVNAEAGHLCRSPSILPGAVQSPRLDISSIGC